MTPIHIQFETSVRRKVLQRLHYPLEIMLVCVRWYAAYPLSLRNLEEMMAERGVAIDHDLKLSNRRVGTRLPGAVAGAPSITGALYADLLLVLPAPQNKLQY